MICNNFVLKIAECCNIACRYCYMFRGGDTSFQNKPKLMSLDIANMAIKRAKEHCQKHNIPVFNFVLHGGEPLIAGKKFITKFVDYTKKEFSGTKTKVIVGLQTNGTLIDDEWCELFKNYNINVGISIDGIKEDNDKNRVDRKGNGTFDRIVKAVKLCQKHGVEPGLLSVINPNTNPKDWYNMYKSLQVKAADILLLEANYDKLPPKATYGPYTNSETPYGDWYIDFFNIWFNDTDNFFNRHLCQYIKSILGAEIDGDDMGEGDNTILTIESNGSYESEDALRICGDGFTHTDQNIFSCDVDEALEAKLSKTYYYSHKELNSICKRCPIRVTCGGGYMPHRFSKENGFNNPSVYCRDLLKLICHVQNKVVDALGKSQFSDIQLDKINYKETLNYLYN